MLYQLSYGTDIMVKRKNLVLMSFARFVYAICITSLDTTYYINPLCSAKLLKLTPHLRPLLSIPVSSVSLRALVQKVGIGCLLGYTHGGGEGPLGPENTIFSRFLPLNYAICIFEICFFLAFCYVGGLRKPAGS